MFEISVGIALGFIIGALLKTLQQVKKNMATLNRIWNHLRSFRSYEGKGGE